MDPTGQDIRFMEMKDAISKLNNKVESLTRSFEETKAREAEHRSQMPAVSVSVSLSRHGPACICCQCVWSFLFFPAPL